ncbi:Glucosyl-3-phosphoglycerate/mannosyl-3- phosphoglycerate phosphatase [Luteitalea pratensis]|uniref:Glucosyl-3-phosphoglycerate/mannosyl-3-phosphoglycerate phosphatase n=1 Tax=Luteitalea pratensis TaxID=1855912 RepID=A0A143PG31_LUTPR|nr:HAD-IIB family hydrolase [Luteitalea pratensis]AMY07517.1 Glucosyl-3-phosphoglycerate/mannosyl-3- phosphoglycerate phosphatase [Luteitalea pratensis]
MRLIVTDLDGSLIDHDTYLADAARPALDAARAAGVPIVPCSSKTLAEMRRLVVQVDLVPAPLIVENGGALWFPADWPRLPPGTAALGDRSALLILGADVAWLRPRLDLVAAATGTSARGFSRMTDAEVAHRTGLTLDVAALARKRQFSEPFLCEGDEVPLRTLDDAARRVGARVTRGGRFFHLTGDTDKGVAVNVLRACCPPGVRLLGLGDAPNDISLLKAVDDPVIVPGVAGTLHPDLVAALPLASHASSTGPFGWNAAVLDWLVATEPQR